MSTHHDIPFDIQTEIVKRIPDVKSLIRFRSVSKPWKSLIDSSKFVADYKSNNHHMLVGYQIKRDDYLVSVVDDDSFPQHNFPLALPNSVKSELLGSSQGLLCFYITEPGKAKGVAVVWNPSIRKSVTIHVPDMNYNIGFGVCPRTSDPKLVRIRHDKLAEVFTLSSGAWRSLSINLPNISATSFMFFWDDRDHQAVVDGILYWHATTSNDNVNDRYNRIITFDLTSEEFGEVCLPDRLATRSYHKLSISKLNESLVVLEYYNNEGHYQACDARDCDLWMMEPGASNLFKKLFTIKPPVGALEYYSCFVRGFRMNGQPIIEAYNNKKSILQVYDPCNGQINDHDLRIGHRVFFKGCYTETLLLLNQSDSIIH